MNVKPVCVAEGGGCAGAIHAKPWTILSMATMFRYVVRNGIDLLSDNERANITKGYRTINVESQLRFW